MDTSMCRLSDLADLISHTIRLFVANKLVETRLSTYSSDQAADCSETAVSVHN